MSKKLLISGLICLSSLFGGCVLETAPPPIWIPAHTIYFADGSFQYIPGHYEYHHNWFPRVQGDILINVR